LEQLEAALLGLTGEAESNIIESHLERCPRCLEQTRQLQASDTWVDLLRRQQAPTAHAELPESTRRLMQSLKALPSIHSDLQFSFEDPLPEAGTSDAPANDFLKQLAPAEGPDELGRLGGFRILEVLGQGGMGVVFRAQDVQLDRPVAIKIMHAAFAARKNAAERFLREARAAASIRHDHVVTIYQVGEDRGVPYMAQELLIGESLESLLCRRLPDRAEALRIGHEAALGLAAAHSRGLLHRDIKPANIWLENGRRRVKLLDFGLVRSRSGKEIALTGTGVILGTPLYMAPEQAAAGAVDERSDLFSLGCVLYRMTTGQLPFPKRETISPLNPVDFARPPAPRSLRGGLSQPVSDLIESLLAIEPGRRPASAEDVAATLLTLFQAELKSRSPLEMTGRWVRALRNWIRNRIQR
jgi:serine/threonine protein kinase